LQRIEIARYSPAAPRFPEQGGHRRADFGEGDGMSQGLFYFSSSDVLELAHLDRTLTHLARPASSQEWKAPLTTGQLIDLGLFASGPPLQRKDLIERLWSRKRELIRRADELAQRGPDRPVA
jgi:hypothetical protein